MNTSKREDPVWKAAWDWVLREHEQGPLGAAAQAELARWLQASPDHLKAYEQASRLWLMTGLVPPAAGGADGGKSA